MVSRTISLGLGLFLLAAGARADLQLKPQTGEYELEGFKFTRVVFQDSNGERVTYSPPSDWEYTGDVDRFVLHPKQKTGAEAAITRASLSKPQVFDEETMKQLSAEAINSLPNGASQTEIVAQEKNPVLIERKETYLVVINYTLRGHPQSRSVMFVNRANEQLRFQLTCGRPDFKELQKAFLGSHFSWQNL